jgi:hypothetical protein
MPINERLGLFDEAGMPILAQPCAALTAANAEREALEAIHEFLGIAAKRLYPTPDKPNSDWAKLQVAVDALALLEVENTALSRDIERHIAGREKGAEKVTMGEREAFEAAMIRLSNMEESAHDKPYPGDDEANAFWAFWKDAQTSLTARKVAEQEPTGFKTVPVKVTDAMIDAANAAPSGIAGSPPHWQWVWDALLSAAPQQSAEPKESDIGMVAVPKRAVDLLAQVRKDGIGHRASELQEVYRLLFAKGE